jgi:hypothetical protein
MILAIQDANILMDLHKAGLLEAYFRLGIETHTTDLVLLEVRPSVAPFVLTGQLRVKTTPATEMAALLAFKAQQPPSLSLEDCSVFHLALQLSAILLTGDNKLRVHAEKARVEAHGILWLLDLMVEDAILDMSTATSCLDQLLKANARLPADECQRRLKLWAAGRRISIRRPATS